MLDCGLRPNQRVSILCICTNCYLSYWLASVSAYVLMQRQAGLGALLLPLQRRSRPRSSACSSASLGMSPTQLATRRTPCCINCSKTCQATCAGLCTLQVHRHRGSPETLHRQQLPQEPCRCACACCSIAQFARSSHSPLTHAESRCVASSTGLGRCATISRVAVHGESSALLR